MTDRAFDYDHDLLNACVSSRSIHPFEGQGEAAPSRYRHDDNASPIINDQNTNDNEDPCQKIYNSFRAHYKKDTYEKDENDYNSRLSRFISNAIFVTNHNLGAASPFRDDGVSVSSLHRRHTVSLNQFSDMYDDRELPFADYKSMKGLGLNASFLSSDFMVGKHKHHKAKKIKHDDRYISMTIGSSSTRDFKKSLNWATTLNSDGVGIVHPPIDQGACGSCWAITATGSLEASIARNVALKTYSSVMRELKKNNSVTDNVWGRKKGGSNKQAIKNIQDIAWIQAQYAEIKALEASNLSVQELIDCDTLYDKGCIGGNPTIAFFYIHKNGLTSASNYPYAAEQGICQIEKTTPPIATVDSWGILSANDEDNMELVLRYIGPIAVGFNAADPSFLSYHSGIFNTSECSADLNHAMLLVGFGEEIMENGSLAKYWIARNSWGTGWGEDGYVRVARGDKRVEGGVCGIAKTPSVALGGELLYPIGKKDEFIPGTIFKEMGEPRGGRHNEVMPPITAYLLPLLISVLLVILLFHYCHLKKCVLGSDCCECDSDRSGRVVAEKTPLVDEPTAIVYGSTRQPDLPHPL